MPVIACEPPAPLTAGWIRDAHFIRTAILAPLRLGASVQTADAQKCMVQLLISTASIAAQVGPLIKFAAGKGRAFSKSGGIDLRVQGSQWPNCGGAPICRGFWLRGGFANATQRDVLACVAVSNRSIYGRPNQPSFRVLDRPLVVAYIRAYTHGCDSGIAVC